MAHVGLKLNFLEMFKPNLCRPPTFDRFNNFDHHDLTVKYCYFRCSNPPDVDTIKISD